MVKDFSVGEVIVEGNRAGNLMRANPINQFDAQLRMIDERLFQNIATVLPAESAERQRIMLAARADIVGEKIILSDFEPLLGMIPKVPGVRDEVTSMVDQGVVDGDNAVGGVAARRIRLEVFE